MITILTDPITFKFLCIDLLKTAPFLGLASVTNPIFAPPQPQSCDGRRLCPLSTQLSHSPRLGAVFAHRRRKRAGTQAAARHGDAAQGRIGAPLGRAQDQGRQRHRQVLARDLPRLFPYIQRHILDLLRALSSIRFFLPLNYKIESNTNPSYLRDNPFKN
jgi:hypothetical protein